MLWRLTCWNQSVYIFAVVEVLSVAFSAAAAAAAAATGVVLCRSHENVELSQPAAIRKHTHGLFEYASTDDAMPLS